MKERRQKMLKWSCFPIETERLEIRGLRREDIYDVYEIFSCEETMNACGIEAIGSQEEACALMEQLICGNELAIVHKETTTLIGTIGIISYDETHERAEISFELQKEFRRFGYMTEALEALVQALFVFGSIHRIEAFTSKANKTSMKLLSKIGFTREGLLRKRNLLNNVFEDCYVYAILKNDQGGI